MLPAFEGSCSFSVVIGSLAGAQLGIEKCKARWIGTIGGSPPGVHPESESTIFGVSYDATGVAPSTWNTLVNGIKRAVAHAASHTPNPVHNDGTLSSLPSAGVYGTGL